MCKHADSHHAMPKIHSFLAVLPRFLMALRLGDNADVFSFSAAISACEKCGHWPLGRLAALWRNWVLFSNESNNPAENYWIYSFWGPCWNFLRSGIFFLVHRETLCHVVFQLGCLFICICTWTSFPQMSSQAFSSSSGRRESNRNCMIESEPAP